MVDIDIDVDIHAGRENTNTNTLLFQEEITLYNYSEYQGSVSDI